MPLSGRIRRLKVYKLYLQSRFLLVGGGWDLAATFGIFSLLIIGELNQPSQWLPLGSPRALCALAAAAAPSVVLVYRLSGASCRLRVSSSVPSVPSCSVCPVRPVSYQSTRRKHTVDACSASFLDAGCVLWDFSRTIWKSLAWIGTKLNVRRGSSCACGPLAAFSETTGNVISM